MCMNYIECVHSVCVCIYIYIYMWIQQLKWISETKFLR